MTSENHEPEWLERAWRANTKAERLVKATAQAVWHGQHKPLLLLLAIFPLAYIVHTYWLFIAMGGPGRITAVVVAVWLVGTTTALPGRTDKAPPEVANDADEGCACGRMHSKGGAA